MSNPREWTLTSGVVKGKDRTTKIVVVANGPIPGDTEKIVVREVVTK